MPKPLCYKDLSLTSEAAEQQSVEWGPMATWLDLGV